MVKSVLMVWTLVLGVTGLAPTASATTGAKAATPTRVTPGAVIFFGYGEMIFEVGPLPEKYRKQKWLEGYKAGYRCRFFSLFWAYIHRWECKPTVFLGKKYFYDDLSNKDRDTVIKAIHAHIEKKYTLADAKLGWWAVNGRWVVGGAILLFILLGMVRRAKRRRF